jgi:hypothetical protein
LQAYLQKKFLFREFRGNILLPEGFPEKKQFENHCLLRGPRLTQCPTYKLSNCKVYSECSENYGLPDYQKGKPVYRYKITVSCVTAMTQLGPGEVLSQHFKH